MRDTNEAKVNIEEQAEMPSLSLSKILRMDSDVVVELAFERKEISKRLAKLKVAIQRNPEGVSDHHKELWRKQAEAMQAYKEVLGERIKDLIDG